MQEFKKEYIKKRGNISEINNRSPLKKERKIYFILLLYLKNIEPKTLAKRKATLKLFFIKK
jgi:hypothetical protein